MAKRYGHLECVSILDYYGEPSSRPYIPSSVATEDVAPLSFFKLSIPQNNGAS